MLLMATNTHKRCPQSSLPTRILLVRRFTRSATLEARICENRAIHPYTRAFMAQEILPALMTAANEAGRGGRLWDDTLNRVGTALLSPMGAALFVFNQAAVAFDSEAPLGTSILCRSALEAACYAVLTSGRFRPELGDWEEEVPMGLDRKMRRVEWSEILAAIRLRGVLTDDQLRNMRRVREHGNVVAHIGPRMHKGTAAATRSGPSKDGLEKMTWITPETAWDDLTATADIVIGLSGIFRLE